MENLCSKFYADKMGRPSLTPGIYFRSLMIGYFEGIESERGIAWRMEDSLSLFWRLRSSRASSSRVGVSIPEALAKPVKNWIRVRWWPLPCRRPTWAIRQP